MNYSPNWRAQRRAREALLTSDQPQVNYWFHAFCSSELKPWCPFAPCFKYKDGRLKCMRSASACKCITVHTEQGEPACLVVAVIKAGRRIPNLYSIYVQSLSRGQIHSSTTVCSSIQGTIRKEKTWKGEREKEKKKERGLRVKPSPETPLQHSHRERKRKSEVKQKKKWQRLVSLD